MAYWFMAWSGTREIAVPRGTGRPGQGDALDSLWQAVRNGRPSRHNARWGRDTIEVILAVLQSAKAGARCCCPRRIDSRLTLR